MKKFHFPLSTVQKIHKEQIKIGRIEAYKVQKQMMRVHLEKKKIENEIEKTQAEFSQSRLNGKAFLYEEYLITLQNQKENFELKLGHFEKKLTELQKKILETHQKEKMIEKLKQKKYSRWRREKMKIEEYETSQASSFRI